MRGVADCCLARGGGSLRTISGARGVGIEFGRCRGLSWASGGVTGRFIDCGLGRWGPCGGSLSSVGLLGRSVISAPVERLSVFIVSRLEGCGLVGESITESALKTFARGLDTAGALAALSRNGAVSTDIE